MSGLNLQQITDRLNKEFKEGSRKIVFWYDDAAEFIDDVDSLDLQNVKVHRLAKDNQFQTKYILEKLDSDSNYLVYAPFPKPPNEENHLLDTLLYSLEFHADRPSLIVMELGINEELKKEIREFDVFFKAKDRIKKLKEFVSDDCNQESLKIAMMNVATKSKLHSFDEVVKEVIINQNQEENEALEELTKYNLEEDFWLLCEKRLGYIDVKPTGEKLAMTLFATYANRFISNGKPKAWESFISNNTGSVLAFMKGFMNNIQSRDDFDTLSKKMETSLAVRDSLKDYDLDSLIECDAFIAIDKMIIDWIVERLMDEDTVASLQGKSIKEVCQLRRKMHFGRYLEKQYTVLETAASIIENAKYSCPDNIEEATKCYMSKDFQIDRSYREFYYAYDRLEDFTKFEKLRSLVENIYTNRYLAELVPKWNWQLAERYKNIGLTLQRNFYSEYIKHNNDKLVVIISDALRYEVGEEIYQRLQDDEKSSSKLYGLLGMLPSSTQVGMASLLPHNKLSLSDECKILVDGQTSDDLKQRALILKTHNDKSRVIQYDDIKLMDKESLREVFTGMEVVYVYHNQIDARGDKLVTENEVFNACKEAVEEIYSLIRRLSLNANVYHFMVTADHGFLYKRDKLDESDKIGGMADKGTILNRRYIISDKEIIEDGVINVKVSDIINSDDNRFVTVPLGSNVFKVQGGGQNYVHGGSSPQEIILPLIDVKMEKGRVETQPAQIKMVSMVQKISNLSAFLEFIQTDPVSDVVKAASYVLYIISEDNEKVSGEHIYQADSEEASAADRTFKLRFDLKNKKYDRKKKHYIMAYDEKTGLEALRHEVIIDIAFADDYGFDS